jgi:hypothetical protein
MNHVISDPEGYDITTLFDGLKGTFLVNGDLIDSTSIRDIKPIEYLKLKSNNLKNIHTILTEDKYTLIFGNRDLNKIKCRFLNELQGSDILIQSFNNGSIDLSIKTYEPIKQKLLSEPWKIDSMNHWYTFWSPTVGDKNKKDWTIKSDYSKSPFLTRFNEIFGADNTIGTMSAGNLLYTIPNEIGINDTNEDYLAFIVLAIFKSMLIKDNSKLNKKFPIITNSSFVKGWLYQLYTNEKNESCLIRKNGENTYLYSHGGITNDIVDLFVNNKLADTWPYSLKPTEYDKYFLDAHEFYNELKGGYINNGTIQNYSYETINNLCTYINSHLKKNIADVFSMSEMNIPSTSMLFILLMSAPFSCYNFSQKIKNVKDCKEMNTNIISPILPGVYEMRQRMFNLDSTLYQVIGHLPLGYSASIDQIDSSYLINMDISNSYHSTESNNIKASPITKTILTENIGIKSVINLNLEKINYTYDIVFSNEASCMEGNNIKHNGKLVRSDSLTDSNFNITIDFKNLDGLDQTNVFSGEKKLGINYHGISMINKIKYYILSLTSMKISFQKTLLVLNEKDFKNFTLIKSSWENKYLKYKMKYLALKSDYKI